MNAGRAILVRVLLAACLLPAAIPSAAPGLLVERRQTDWVGVEFYEDPAARGASFEILLVGRDYYAGIPPRNSGGAGGADLCVTLQDNVAGHHVAMCFGDDFEFESLRSASADGSATVEVRNGAGDVVMIDTLIYDVSFTAAGAVYPGASASTRPDPASGVAATLLRAADVDGYIWTAALGMFDLTGRAGVFGRTRGFTAFPLQG